MTNSTYLLSLMPFKFLTCLVHVHLLSVYIIHLHIRSELSYSSELSDNDVIKHVPFAIRLKGYAEGSFIMLEKALLKTKAFYILKFHCSDRP